MGNLLRAAYISMAFFAATAGSSARVDTRPQTEFRASFRLPSGGRVLVQNPYGNVRIVAWDREEVQVYALKKSIDPARLREARVVVNSSDNQVEVHTEYAGADAEHPPSVDYRIMVPRDAHLADIRLINGTLTIQGAAGRVKATSVNGAIRVEGLAGEAELSTVNGSLEAGFDAISAEKPIHLSSINGPIRLTIPADSGATLEAQNRAGGIDSEFGSASRHTSGHLLHAVVKRGGARISLHNVNGGISIRTAVKGERPWS